MIVRRIRVATEGGQVRLELEMGHASEPMKLAVKLDPATALVLSGHLETAVHQLQISTPTNPDPCLT